MANEKIINKSTAHTIPHTHRTTSPYEMKLSVWTGVLTSVALIVFFLIMKLVGLEQILWVRYFNFVFFVIGLVSAFNIYSTRTHKLRINYLKGIKMGLRITLIAIIPFVIFMFVYLSIDNNFMIYVRENSDFGRYLSPISAAAVIAIEGFVGGAITTYMAMQYFKDNAT